MRYHEVIQHMSKAIAEEHTDILDPLSKYRRAYEMMVKSVFYN